MEIQDYLRILRTRWMIIVVTVAVAVLGALAVSLLTTPTYQSCSRVFVSTSGGSTVSESYQGNLFSQQRVASYSELVTGETLASRTIDELGLSMTPAQLAAKVTATSTPDTVLLDICVVDTAPETARNVANSLASQLTTLVRELETPEDGGSAAAGVRSVEQAQASSSPISPKTTRNLALGAAVGLLLGIALAVLRDRLDNTIKTRSRLEAAAKTSLVGTIPFDKDLKETSVVSFGAARSSSAEAFRELRTNLQFLEVDHPPRVIVVTSAVPTEGKTTVAVNLALALAEAGHHVALVEGDLRRPRVSKYLNLIGSVGLSTVLAGQAELSDVLQPSSYEGLEVLASGPLPPNPSELLGSEASRRVIEELRGRFDYVILDGAPLLPVTDSALLTTHSDGALVVARFGHTSESEVTRAVENLEKIGAHILGAVFTMMPQGRKGGENYSYYYETDKSIPHQVPNPVTPGSVATQWDSKPAEPPASPSPTAYDNRPPAVPSAPETTESVRSTARPSGPAITPTSTPGSGAAPQNGVTPPSRRYKD
ncbi:polysaccharide biosynthesis tyrosine autokinase [Rhodococcus sp. P1Y]|uniref:polysaccharide biosynthesis tyrosine autokinase n=1 Tax=Rhodococcus sp. P1Y TaxID=1302308 RepID=UPI000EB4DAF0|nr:polysaccharide biosynthesis tyrosine autokinase [Rhodococcus sp. P1Y]AYJ48121.1 polysaccharide biosynthesis tyrosine autokinase [Rhodococcus sp. P1Y]